jgi:hypothetical protein
MMIRNRRNTFSLALRKNRIFGALDVHLQKLVALSRSVIGDPLG